MVCGILLLYAHWDVIKAEHLISIVLHAVADVHRKGNRWHVCQY